MNSKEIKICLLLALFNFCFLGTEYLFDDMMALVVDQRQVVNAQNIVLGASVLGFISFWWVNRRLPKDSSKILVLICLGICIGCEFVIQNHSSYGSILCAGLIVFIIMGVMGSAACFFASRSLEKYQHMGKLVGISYALGVLIQFVNNNCVKSDAVEAIVISVLMGVLVGISINLAKNVSNQDEIKNGHKTLDEKAYYSLSVKQPSIPVATLVACVALMTIIFSTLDNAVTLVHASGEFNIGQWPRSLLAVSGLIAGFLYDLYARRLMTLLMYMVTLLSVISIVVIQFGGTFVIGLMVFYVAAGFFVVFFMVGFMDISFQTKLPMLWAGLGRAINNLCAFITTSVSVSLLEKGSQMTIMIVALVLFVLLTCAVTIYYAVFLKTERELELETLRTKLQEKESKVDWFESFVTTYSFTERERDVMKELITNGDSVGDISKALYISRATLYRHINSMTEKTGVTSRRELIQFYYSSQEK